MPTVRCSPTYTFGANRRTKRERRPGVSRTACIQQKRCSRHDGICRALRLSSRRKLRAHEQERENSSVVVDRCGCQSRRTAPDKARMSEYCSLPIECGQGMAHHYRGNDARHGHGQAVDRHAPEACSCGRVADRQAPPRRQGAQDDNGVCAEVPRQRQAGTAAGRYRLGLRCGLRRLSPRRRLQVPFQEGSIERVRPGGEVDPLHIGNLCVEGRPGALACGGNP